MLKTTTLDVLRLMKASNDNPLFCECLRTAIDELEFTELWSNALPDRIPYDADSRAIRDIWHMARTLETQNISAPADLHAYFKSVNADADSIIQLYHWAVTRYAEALRQELDARQLPPLPADAFD